MGKQIFDNHGRLVNYVRLAVTDRCNLRCFYCMPEEGIDYVNKQELLSYEEILRLMRIMAGLGIEKVRITGGEPFVRKDMMDLLSEISKIQGINQIHITTNGTLTAALVPELKKIGIASVNLSLDTLDKERFFKVTRRDEFDNVMATFHALLAHGIKTKLNSVVIKDKNDTDILNMVALTKDYPVDVRFIEEMPFNGEGSHYDGTLFWTYKKILEHIKTSYPAIYKIEDAPHSTSMGYQIPGHKGKVGIIAAYSRTFCGTCNRIRVTPQGGIKTCLYDGGTFNIKQLMRSGATNAQVADTLIEAISHRAKDGYEAEKNRTFGFPVSESMTTIGG